MENLDEIKYQEAVKRVKKIKGFYTHLAVYVVINIALLIMRFQKLHDGDSIFTLRNFSTALFWGIGLAAHGLSVFLPTLILTSDWEQKKIKELMDKEKKNKWE